MREEPQFGVREPLRWYRRRPCAFGLAEQKGRLALVRITRKGKPPRLDLPGGALDAGETAAAGPTSRNNACASVADRPVRSVREPPTRAQPPPRPGWA